MKYLLAVFCLLFLSCRIDADKLCYYSVRVTYIDQTKEILTITNKKRYEEPFLYKGELIASKGKGEKTYRSYIRAIEILAIVCEE